MAVEQRIDMALIDEAVLAFIEASDHKALTFLEIARGVRCSAMTARRSVVRLEAVGRLKRSRAPGRIFRFEVPNGDKPDC